MNTKKIAVVGGDLRFVRLTQILVQKGFEVIVYGITHPDIPTAAGHAQTLDDLKACHYIIGPIPFSQDGKSVFTPLSNTYISIELFVEAVANNELIVGALKKPVKELFDKHHLHYTDLMEMDEIAILNAIPTAEGAIQYAMQNSEITLHNSKCLVMGFGRCGKILAHKLKGIGCEVYVEARSTTDLAFVSTYDYIPVPLPIMKEFLNQFDFIFNTIPVVLLNEEEIKLIAPHTVYIELASPPGGIDLCCSHQMGINHVPAPSLPGKVAPTTAAQILYEGLKLIMERRGDDYV